MRILVIDDEKKTRSGIIHLINRLNPELNIVGEAENGYDGMMLIRELHPDVVITDIMMPKVNGLEMIENVKSSSPHTKFIILSGYAEFELARQAVKLSVVDYLLKPITPEQMRAALAALQQKTSIPPEEPDPSIKKAYSDITKFIIDEINKNYTGRLYLEDIANHLRVTPEYAGNVFSKETGKSFSVFLKIIRMEKAKELIENTNDKIYEIAYKTGYSDVKYFCRVFKEYTGVSAKTYLRSIIK